MAICILCMGIQFSDNSFSHVRTLVDYLIILYIEEKSFPYSVGIHHCKTLLLLTKIAFHFINAQKMSYFNKVSQTEPEVDLVQPSDIDFHVHNTNPIYS